MYQLLWFKAKNSNRNQTMVRSRPVCIYFFVTIYTIQIDFYLRTSMVIDQVQSCQWLRQPLAFGQVLIGQPLQYLCMGCSSEIDTNIVFSNFTFTSWPFLLSSQISSSKALLTVFGQRIHRIRHLICFNYHIRM